MSKKQAEEIRQLPMDVDTEAKVIGVLLNYPKLYESASDVLRDEYFASEKYKCLFRNIGKMVSQGEAVTLTSLFTYCNQYPDKYVKIDIHDLLEVSEYYDADSLGRMCSYLQDVYKKRAVTQMVERTLIDVSMSSVTSIDIAIDNLSDGLKGLSDDSSVQICSARDALRSLEDIMNKNASGGREAGVMTGFSYFDERGGLQKGDLVVIAGRSSNGKTALALDMAVNGALQGYPSAYYSFEMKKERLMSRAVSAHIGISSNVLMNHPLTLEQYEQYDRGIGKLAGMPLFFDDRSKPRVETLKSSIRTMVHKKGIKVAYIDYLQILSAYKESRENEEQFLGRVSRMFKDLALELGIAIVILSQLNRSKEQGETWQPRIDNLRGSGQINEAADTVLLIYRPEVYHEVTYKDFPDVSVEGTAEIIIGKGRNIGTGQFLLNFDAPHTHFSEIIGAPPKREEPKQETIQFAELNDTPF